jgi:hypothetical protein
MTATPAQGSDKPSIPWVGTNPYVFGMGDSLFEQCRPDMGLGWRSLGIVGWPGATTTAMRERMTSDAEGWPHTTETNHAEELTWFRDAGAWAIGLGTNDVKTLTVEQWRNNIDWFMRQANGRPVTWYTIHNPPFQQQAELFNWELFLATDRWPNLKLIEWHKWVAANPAAMLPDGVHVATYEYGCQLGRHRLLQHAVPDVPGHTKPRGYWYEGGGLTVAGWGAGNAPNRRALIHVNVRVDWKHHGRFPVDQWSGDLWAQTASGRAFSVRLPSSARGRTVCVDLVDADNQWTSLGCRVV